METPGENDRRVNETQQWGRERKEAGELMQKRNRWALAGAGRIRAGEELE